MNDYWEVQIEHYGLIRIKLSLIGSLLNYIQNASSAPEAGGVLIGKHLNQAGRLVVEGYTPPQPSDKQKRSSYFRSAAHSAIVKKLWIDSGGHSTFVGLWHTHPEPHPTPSKIDIKDWSNVLDKSHYEGEHLLFFIVGQKSMSCWIGERGERSNEITHFADYEYKN